jgi:hypothetical protein
MPKIRRTQRSQDTEISEPTPTPTPSRVGRQRVYTNKKKENGTLSNEIMIGHLYSLLFSY